MAKAVDSVVKTFQRDAGQSTKHMCTKRRWFE